MSFGLCKGFKKLFRRLRASSYKLVTNKEDLSEKVLAGVDALFAAP